MKYFVENRRCSKAIALVALALAACTSGSITITPTQVVTAVQTICQFQPTISSVEGLLAAASGNPLIVGGVVTVNSVANAICAALAKPAIAKQALSTNSEITVVVGGVPISGHYVK